MAGWQRIATLEIDWSGAPLGELMAHLVLVHHNRFRVEIPALQGLMQEVYAGYRQRDFARLARLPGLLFVLGNELEQHMRREELAIFPAIEALEKSVETGEEPAFGCRSVAAVISEAIPEHDDILDRLAEARRFTCDYECPSDADQSYRNLFQRLDALDHHLNLHIRLEDSVFSRALSLA